MNFNESLAISFGLEIHITVQSRQKIFNWENLYQGGEIPPNSRAGVWELGYLGVLPIINSEVINLGLRLAAALDMKISPVILFDRKIYNYFDLPKGYQITQQKTPLATTGYLPIIKDNKIEKIPLKILQLEEDTAKSSYDKEKVNLDFNRAGNPLIELVTEPVFSQVETVLIFIKQLQNLCRYLDISEAKMEQGQLRVDLNYSLRLGGKYATPRYEIKNLNSLANIKKAVQYEITKHQDFFRRGTKPPLSQTLGFDEEKKITVSQREKTSYFYLPEVNIPPIKLFPSEIEKITRNIPPLPWLKWEQLVKKGAGINRSNLILEKPFLLKSLIFLEKKNLFLPAETSQWISFFLNYLGPFLTKENFVFFQKRWKSYWKIFQLGITKELENQEIKLIIQQLITTQKTCSYLIKKHQKKEKIDEFLISSTLEKLWNDNLTQKYATKPQNVRNFLHGQIKKTFPNLDSRKFSQIIVDFIERRIKI